MQKIENGIDNLQLLMPEVCSEEHRTHCTQYSFLAEPKIVSF